jgi:hypothetical protein
MSDIVERARNLRGGVCTDDCYDLVQELADEIVQLRAETDPYIELRMEAEIERLRADKEAISQTASDYLHEIERLRGVEGRRMEVIDDYNSTGRYGSSI